jgi:hypothetical protein
LGAAIGSELARLESADKTNQIEINRLTEESITAAGRYDEFRKRKDIVLEHMKISLRTSREGHRASKVENERLRNECDTAMLKQKEADEKYRIAAEELADTQRQINERKHKIEEQEVELRSAKRQATEAEQRARTADETAHQMRLHQVTIAGIEARLR